MIEVGVPLEWIQSNLEYVGDVVTGKTPSKKNPEYFEGSIPFIKPGDINDQGKIKYTDEYITDLGAKTVPTIPTGSIVVTCIGNLGRCAITSERSATNQQINSVIPCNEVDVRFLYYQLRTLKKWMLSESSATTVTIINKSRFSRAPIVVPPLAEQKIIADKLDTLLAQVETTKARLERIPNILKSFRQSVLAAAVSGKLTEEWRERNNPTNVTFNHIKDIKLAQIKSKEIKKDLDAVQMEPVNGVPNDWLTLKLKSIASKITDGEHKTPKRENVGRYLLSARNVQDGYISTSNVDFVGEEEFQKLRKRCDPNKGDILISCSGSVGRVCLVDEDDKYVMVRSAALVRFMDEFIQGKYLMYYLQSPISQKEIEESSKSTAQANLFLGPIKDLTLALPSLSEQTEIVRRVEELFAFADTIEQKASAALDRVNNLTQSILAKAFRGELTADWRAANPDLITGENSAEALLEKIKAEREAMKPKKKARKKKSA